MGAKLALFTFFEVLKVEMATVFCCWPYQILGGSTNSNMFIAHSFFKRITLFRYMSTYKPGKIKLCNNAYPSIRCSPDWKRVTRWIMDVFIQHNLPSSKWTHYTSMTGVRFGVTEEVVLGVLKVFVSIFIDSDQRSGLHVISPARKKKKTQWILFTE